MLLGRGFGGLRGWLRPSLCALLPRHSVARVHAGSHTCTAVPVCLPRTCTHECTQTHSYTRTHTPAGHRGVVVVELRHGGAAVPGAAHNHGGCVGGCGWVAGGREGGKAPGMGCWVRWCRWVRCWCVGVWVCGYLRGQLHGWVVGTRAEVAFCSRQLLYRCCCCCFCCCCCCLNSACRSLPPPAAVVAAVALRTPPPPRPPSWAAWCPAPCL